MVAATSSQGFEVLCVSCNASPAAGEKDAGCTRLSCEMEGDDSFCASGAPTSVDG